MLLHSIASLIISSLLCALPFVEPDYAWPLIFLFPLPIFLNPEVLSKNAFFRGYLWGLITLSIQLAGISSALLTITHGSIIIRLVIPIALVCVQAITPAILFFVGALIIKQYSYNKYTTIIVQSIIFLLFFLYFQYTALWFTGTIEGYSLNHPMIALMHLPFFRLVLAHSNDLVLLLMIIGLPTIIAIMVSAIKNRALCLTILAGIALITMYSIEFFDPKPEEPPTWISQIVALPFVFYVPHNMTFLMSAVAHELKKTVQKYPQTSLVVMPESSLYCSFLHLDDLTNLLSEREVSKPIHFIAGSFSFSDNQYHNALYWIDNGALRACYYKRHTMFLTERIPSFLRKTFVEKIFFSQSPIIVQSKNKRPLLEINSDIKLVPYICSELFFNQKPDDTFTEYPILAIANDRHFLPYIADLMVRHAQRIAITWNRPIIYVSFLHHVYINTDGVLFELIV